jgi:small subunit ribosomal protein S6
MAPELEEEQVKQQMERFARIVREQGGEITQEPTVWERRRLAYTVKKRNEGIHILMNVRGDGKILDELSRQFRVSEIVLRHTIVRTG